MSEFDGTLDIHNSPYVAQVRLSRPNGQKIVWGYNPATQEFNLLTRHKVKDEEQVMAAKGLAQIRDALSEKDYGWDYLTLPDKEIALQDTFMTDQGELELLVNKGTRINVLIGLEQRFGFYERPKPTPIKWGDVFNRISGVILGRNSNPQE